MTPDTAAWYVVYAKPHREDVAETHLRWRRVDVFHPQLRLPDYAAGRRKIVPLFPGYLFVHIALATQLHDVIWAPGVNRLVGTHGIPTPLDDRAVALLKDIAEPDGLLSARSTLAPGQHVEISRGPFSGLVAIIHEPPNARGRIKVLMRLLNRRLVHVDVPLKFVKSGWTPAQGEPDVRARL